MQLNLVRFDDYVRLGYTRVSQEEFRRYAMWAIAYADRYTFGRIIRPPDPVEGEEAPEVDTVWENNLTGLCELIDAQYARVNNEDLPLASFSNQKYSESYVSPEPQSPDARFQEIMQLFFTDEQLSRVRGVRSARSE